MRVNEKDLLQEKQYLEDTKGVIKEIIEGKKDYIKESKEKSIASKRFLWERLTEFSDPEMFNTMDDEDVTVQHINDNIIKNARLERAYYSPYFGKIKFDGESLYFGITGVERNLKNYVYDWRAPISNLYYNFGLGNAHYDSPDGEVKGTIEQKRQFKIEMGEMKECFDNEMNLDDEMLAEVLLSSSDDKMKNIVNTIQKDQNTVIRYKGKSNLIIEGVAGSGKTSVALHRIAYLLYNEKDLTSDNVLIFSPNEVFTNYISNVLPELGENNVLSTTLSEFAKNYIKVPSIESLSDFIERYYLEKPKKKEYDLIKFKLSDKFKNLIDEYIKSYIDSINFTKKIGLKKVAFTSEELNNLFHVSAKRLSLPDRINYIAEKMCDRFGIDFDKNIDKMIETLNKVLKLKDNPIKIYQSFLESDIYKNATDDTNEYSFNYINYEDIGAVLYLYFELCGYPKASYIRHIVIDEAQDYTFTQFTLLKKIFNSAKFTILGDSNQTINPYYQYTSVEELTKLFNDVKYIRLNSTYRSSAEIIDYSNKILGLKEVKSIRPEMNMPVLEKEENELKKDLLEDIEYFKSKGLKRIAVITKTDDESQNIFKLLGSKNVSLVTSSILKDIVIVPSYLAKGLEFDGVIAYSSKDDKYTEEEKYLFYVVTTRAQHALIVYNQK